MEFLGTVFSIIVLLTAVLFGRCDFGKADDAKFERLHLPACGSWWTFDGITANHYDASGSYFVWVYQEGNVDVVGYDGPYSHVTVAPPSAAGRRLFECVKSSDEQKAVEAVVRSSK